MKKFTYRFRSIMVNHVEKVIPNTVFSKMVLEMDDTTVEQHTMELSIKDITGDPAWITYFFLTVMIVIPVSGLIFAGVYVGFGRTMDHSAWLMTKIIFLITDIVVILPLWIFLSARGSVGNKKRKYVEQKRGSGNWRIVDESKWDGFYRLLMIAKNQRESEKIIK